MSKVPDPATSAAAASQDPKIDAPSVRHLRRRRRQVLEADTPGPGEEWMLTYMDTVTLLVTLFVMILSFASFEKQTFEQFKQAISIGVKGGGIISGGWGLRDGEARTPNALFDAAPLARTGPPSVPSPQSPDSESPDDPDARAALRSLLAENGLEDDVQVAIQDRSIQFEINASVLFASGQAELSESGARLIRRLKPLLVAAPLRLDIEGHTDDIPIHTQRFPSNWALSGARAAAVADVLIAAGMPETQLRTIGLAATRPLVPNRTDESRRRNRRVNLRAHFPSPDAARQWIRRQRD